ncbi:MAG: hypothetical protein GTO18_04740 [Anaerolineales bacterium]|nr:hypothetical protein [Anaerolineales bacterium]
MTIVGVLGVKGGCGASILATNLAVSLAQHESCLMIDLHTKLAYDDLLLDVRTQRSWVDLLPVAGEITDRHLEIAVAFHHSGVKFLCAPENTAQAIDPHSLSILLQNLARRYEWIVMDLPVGLGSPTKASLHVLDFLLLVTTGDLPALRNAQRSIAEFSKQQRKRVYLVLNQIGKGHPAEPLRVASALGLPLLGTLPLDPRSIGYQISFGMPCVLDTRSKIGVAINRLGQTLRHSHQRETDSVMRRSEGLAGLVSKKSKT